VSIGRGASVLDLCDNAAVVRANLDWMTFNLLLAFLPFALAVWLFVPARPRNALWWAGVGAFVAFLPNAPYVLTDVVHLGGQLRAARTTRSAVGLLVQYGALMAAGLVLYGACLALVRRRLQVDGLGRWRWPVEVAFHALCSIGIFLGRVLRLNSWDIVVRPHEVLGYLGVPRGTTVLLIAMTFAVLVTATLALRVPIAIHELRRSGR
jgi:uncharacterized membrane protein